jgi:UDP-glucose 4-epimerase
LAVHRITLTGGLGFIGLNCLAHWMRSGFCREVVVIDDCSVGSRKDLERMLRDLGEFRRLAGEAQWTCLASVPENPVGIRVTLHVADVSRAEGLAEIVAGSNGVVHLAGQTGVMPSLTAPRRDMEKNVAGSLNMLEACREAGVGRFIFASSSAPLGDCPPPVNENSLPHPLSPYGASKLAVEGYCSAYHAAFGIKTLALRFSNVYGPNSRKKGSVVAAFMRNVLRGQPLTIYGDGSQTRDFLHVDDLCQAVTLALGTDASELLGGPLHIATGIETRVVDLAAAVRSLAVDSGFGEVAVLHEPERAGEIIRTFADIGRAKQSLGYLPRKTLQQGLKETWAWFLGNKEYVCGS